MLEQPKIGVFVDVQNIYYTTRQAFGRAFDYHALWAELGQQGDIVMANAYATNKNDDRQIKFQDALKHIGFTIKLKPYIQRRDGSAKGDWDVGITIDMLAATNQIDHAVLLSGDGDFDLLLHALRQHNITTHVYGVRALTAQSLIDAANHYHPIQTKLLR